MLTGLFGEGSSGPESCAGFFYKKKKKKATAGYDICMSGKASTKIFIIKPGKKKVEKKK